MPPPTWKRGAARESTSEKFGVKLCCDRLDTKIDKLDQQLVKLREQISKTRPGPAQEATKRRALQVEPLAGRAV